MIRKTTMQNTIKIISGNNRERCRFLFGIFLLLSVFVVTPDFLLARENTDTLIINSNESVKKYSQMQTAFKAHFGGQTVEIDIGSKWFEEKTVEKTIRDMKPGLIFCIGSKAYMLASEMAKDTDIIFSLGINWQRFPLTDRTYIISSEPPPLMELTMYRYFFPEIKKVGVIYSINHNKEWFQTAVTGSKEVGIEIIGTSIRKDTEVKNALKNLLPKVDALWLIPDPQVLSSTEQVKEIFDLGNTMKKPVFAYDKLFTNFGAALIISADIATMGGQAAKIANDLLQNKDIPEKMQNPAGSYIAINLKKIESCGIKLNPKALSSVNEFAEQ